MKLLVLDGNSIINRAFYGIKLLSTKSGIFTNGIYGFMNILNHLIEAEKPDGVCIAFDLKAPTFRHQMYAGYKQGRKPMPPELVPQIPLLKQLLTLCGYTCLEKEGYEADDILGTLSSICEKNGASCVISTGDRDSLQLIGKHTTVLLASTKMGRPAIVRMDAPALYEKYGLTPDQMIDLKALMGDSSDKIPGVAGIGEKTALELLYNFQNLDGVYENIDSDKIKPGVRTKLAADKDNAYLSYKLGTICRQVPISGDIDTYKTKPKDKLELAALLRKLEFFKTLEKEGLADLSVPTFEEGETAGFSVGKVDTNNPFYLHLNGFSGAICGEGVCEEIELDTAQNLIKTVPQNIVVFSGKELYKTVISSGIEPAPFCFDNLLAAYLLDATASSYDMPRLCDIYGITVAGELSENGTVAAKGYLLYKKLLKLIKEQHQEKLLYQIEMPLSLVLCEMEQTGFTVDKDGLYKMGSEISTKIGELERKIYDMADEKFNINSPKQLGVILFEKLNLPFAKKTKTGYSTNADILEKLKPYHEIIPAILEYRTLAKLKSTYCEGLLSAAGGDGVIHTTFNQTETRTGRISSLEPNLQNIPVRRAEGAKLREFFVARDNKVLIDADYSQIELRILAALSGDTTMIEAFKNGVDIHLLTASKIFGLPEDMVTPLLRTRAKAVNFGIVYGIGAFSLSQDTGVTVSQAKEFINNYFATYPQIDRYMTDCVNNAKEKGYASTAFGRRRYLPELSSSNHMLRAFGERVARNMPIQGTAADVIKIAMVRVRDRIKKEGISAKLILQVHDELILEADKDCDELAAKILKEEMENAADLAVKLQAEVHIGKNWLEAKG